MPSPVNRSSFLYNLFHSNSDKLSANEQKKFKKINIALGITTLGLGHAICFIAYLIESSCSKAAKTSRVAEPILNPQPPAVREENKRKFNEMITKCVAEFEKKSSFEKLEEIVFVIEKDYQPHGSERLVPERRTKEEALKIINTLSYEPQRTGNSSVSFSLIGKDEKGIETTVKGWIAFQDGKFYGVSNKLDIEDKNAPIIDVTNPLELPLPIRTISDLAQACIDTFDEKFKLANLQNICIELEADNEEEKKAYPMQQNVHLDKINILGDCRTFLEKPHKGIPAITFTMFSISDENGKQNTVSFRLTFENGKINGSVKPSVGSFTKGAPSNLAF